MISVKADIRHATRYLDNVQRRQIPFASMRSLNDTAFEGRKAAQVRMEADFDQVTAFTRSGVQVAKATKQRQRAAVFVEGKRLKYLSLEVHGGTRHPTRKALIIPVRERRNEKDLRPKLLAQKGAFEDTSKRGTRGIWKRTRKEVRLLALYVSRATYRPRFRFFSTVESTVKRVFPVNFKAALARALATAR